MTKKSVLKKISSTEGKVATNARYKWVEFTTDDGQVIECKVRTSLVYDEIEKLVGLNLNTDREELWKATYRYVTEWNLIAEDEKGDLYEILPPREGGPESFRYAQPELVWAIIGTLINEPFKKVDPKSSTPVETTDEP